MRTVRKVPDGFTEIPAPSPLGDEQLLASVAEHLTEMGGLPLKREDGSLTGQVLEGRELEGRYDDDRRAGALLALMTDVAASPDQQG